MHTDQDYRARTALFAPRPARDECALILRRLHFEIAIGRQEQKIIGASAAEWYYARCDVAHRGSESMKLLMFH